MNALFISPVQLTHHCNSQLEHKPVWYLYEDVPQPSSGRVWRHLQVFKFQFEHFYRHLSLPFYATLTRSVMSCRKTSLFLVFPCCQWQPPCSQICCNSPLLPKITAAADVQVTPRANAPFAPMHHFHCQWTASSWGRQISRARVSFMLPRGLAKDKFWQNVGGGVEAFWASGHKHQRNCLGVPQVHRETTETSSANYKLASVSESSVRLNNVFN